MLNYVHMEKIMDIETLKQQIYELSGGKDAKRDPYMQHLLDTNFAGLTGYASQDKPWEYYFDKEKLANIKNDMTMYQDILKSNQGYMNTTALIYFLSKISYGKLFENIDKTSKSYAEYGIKDNDFVTICAAGIPETIYSIYALSKIGGVANMMPPHFDKEDMERTIGNCESDTLIVMENFYPEIKDKIKNTGIKNIIVIPFLNSSPLRFLKHPGKMKLNPKNEIYWNEFIKDGRKQQVPETFPYIENYPICLAYSSGTTGPAKPILLSNDSFQNSVLSYDANIIDVLRGQKMYQMVPPWFATGLSTSIHLPLHRGLQIFQDPRYEREVFVKNIIDQKIDYCVSTSSMYEGFILDDELTKGKKLCNLGSPFAGGEPLVSKTLKQIEEKWKEMGVDTRLLTGYGRTEDGAQTTSQSQNIYHIRGSVGMPLPGVNIAIVDDNFNELPYGQRGNIIVNTPCGMIGYFKNEALTKLGKHIDKNGVEWNITKDIGYILPNGEVFVDGRRDDCTELEDKTIFHFDIEKAVREEYDIKLCDCLKKKDDNNDKLFALHLIFTKKYQSMYSNPTLLRNRLIELQQIIYDKYGDIDYVPEYFKIRDTFPYKKSGKRDAESIENETEAFIYVDKSKLLGYSRKRVNNI